MPKTSNSRVFFGCFWWRGRVGGGEVGGGGERGPRAEAGGKERADLLIARGRVGFLEDLAVEPGVEVVLGGVVDGELAVVHPDDFRAVPLAVAQGDEERDALVVVLVLEDDVAAAEGPAVHLGHGRAERRAQKLERALLVFPPQEAPPEETAAGAAELAAAEQRGSGPDVPPAARR